MTQLYLWIISLGCRGIHSVLGAPRHLVSSLDLLINLFSLSLLNNLHLSQAIIMDGLIGLILYFLLGSLLAKALDFLLYRKFVLLSVLVIASVVFFLVLGAEIWKPKKLTWLVFMFVIFVFFELKVSFNFSWRNWLIFSFKLLAYVVVPFVRII